MRAAATKPCREFAPRFGELHCDTPLFGEGPLERAESPINDDGEPGFQLVVEAPPPSHMREALAACGFDGEPARAPAA